MDASRKSPPPVRYGNRMAMIRKMSPQTHRGTAPVSALKLARSDATAEVIERALRPVDRSRLQRSTSSFSRLLAKEALRSEDHHQDQDPEHDRRRPRLAELEPEEVAAVGDRLDHADDQAADHGALQIADAAH